jgi:PAP2 superfamily
VTDHRDSISARALWARWHGGAEIGLFVVLMLLYELLRDLVEPSSPAVPVANAEDIVGIERSLGLAIEGDVQRLTNDFPGGEFLSSWYYTLAHTPGFIAVFAGIWFFRRRWYPFVRNWFWATNAVAVLVYWLYPLAPPRLAGLGLEDPTKSTLELGGSLSWFQPFRNLYAAMPSMHTGYTILYATAAILLLRGFGARWIFALWPVVMIWVIMATANHFWLDAVGGAIVVGAALALTHLVAPGAMPRPWSYRPPAARPQTLDATPAADPVAESP